METTDQDDYLLKKSLEYGIEDLEEMSADGVCVGICRKCGHEMQVEPDARGYDCEECGTKCSVDSLIEAFIGGEILW
jgi:hypothetical protein